MKKLALLLAVIVVACTPTDPDFAAWEARAEGIDIIRDDWGIAHIYGETDADAVFGMIYAQAEDDFNRIEVNFLNSQGRLAEAEGEDQIWRDLRMKLFIDPVQMQALYAESPQWLKDLMDAWADGLNYYLATHPEVTPRVIDHWEPWMALTFSEGSIGGDIERVSLGQLEAFYGEPDQAMAMPQSDVLPGTRTGDRTAAQSVARTGAGGADTATESSLVYEAGLFAEPQGSNGIAIGPEITEDGNALLLINPHTSFYFRSELHMVSNEGLNAYGAVTWGQFFVYQGFNETAGWMHTSSGVDNIDEALETVVERDGELFYVYGDEERPLLSKQITVPYTTATGMEQREFTVYETHRGPIVRATDGKWVSVQLMEEPLKALQQSYLRSKAANYDEYVETMRFHTNSSNNTLFADADGNIAYFHSNFIPIRDTSFDYTRPVDGSDPATDWTGVHTVEEAPNMVNPANGWVQNTNNWPYSVSGALSPRQEDYPVYVQRSGENFRGEHALMLLEGSSGFTLDGLIETAYDSYLPAFAAMVPGLLRAYADVPADHPMKIDFAGPMETLEEWDYRWGAESVATSVAIFWGRAFMALAQSEARQAGMGVYDYMVSGASPSLRLQAMADALDRLTEDFGSWETPWGEINRFQRLTGDIVQPHDDDAPSIPVAFASGRWGSLASYGAAPRNGSKKFYGTSGNSFVAVVEFGDSVTAKAVTAGGLHSDPSNPHFNDQAERYAEGDLRPVYFYRNQLEGHIEREYHPGG